MLVYGDHSETVDVREWLGAIDAELTRVNGLPAGIERHARLVGALIDAGRLVQGMADRGEPTGELDRFLHRLAGSVVLSVDSGFGEIGALPSTPSASSIKVELRLAEGFAFYAVYPEAYARAARQLRLAGPARVIGIRSIGTTLASVVAEALGAPRAINVRPFGAPFARRVELPREIVEASAHYIIVDEGPGLSGSSFGAAADWLEARGVPLERIAFLPSHGGDLGPQASEAHRRRWRRAQRVPALFDPAFLEERFGRLRPFSTGQPMERIKYRVERDGEPLLLKFSGLGTIGTRKLEMTRLLHAAGLTPEPLEIVHGFLVERWQEDSRPLRDGEKPVDEIGTYLRARARLFPASPESGATIDELITMCRRNISLALGHEAAMELPRWDAEALARSVVRVRTDNKLDRDKWLRSADGRLLKTDALDHHQAHDLIGCQDVAWDIAGAAVEFELDQAEVAQLIAATGLPIDRELLAFYRVAYPAFRLGQAAITGADGDRYGRGLDQFLHDLAPATPQESSFN